MSEKSGLNLMSQFNLDNVTEFTTRAEDYDKARLAVTMNNEKSTIVLLQQHIVLPITTQQCNDVALCVLQSESERDESMEEGEMEEVIKYTITLFCQFYRLHSKL